MSQMACPSVPLVQGHLCRPAWVASCRWGAQQQQNNTQPRLAGLTYWWASSRVLYRAILVGNYIRLGQVPYATVAVSSPLPSRSGFPTGYLFGPSFSFFFSCLNFSEKKKLFFFEMFFIFSFFHFFHFFSFFHFSFSFDFFIVFNFFHFSFFHFFFIFHLFFPFFIFFSFFFFSFFSFHFFIFLRFFILSVFFIFIIILLFSLFS